MLSRKIGWDAHNLTPILVDIKRKYWTKPNLKNNFSFSKKEKAKKHWTHTIFPFERLYSNLKFSLKFRYSPLLLIEIDRSFTQDFFKKKKKNFVFIFIFWVQTISGGEDSFSWDYNDLTSWTMFEFEKKQPLYFKSMY